ncbi:MAG TPA: LysE family translocator [Allosphingosinicella sp.]|jgi:threonine/homoserine/homoserine lactone efflux protein
MTGELGTAALLTVAAITPGPNNLIVMAAARRGGWVVALRSILGVVLGSLALLSVCLLGLRAVGHASAMLFDLCTIGGGFYLAWLGLRLAWRPETDPAQVGASLTPARLILIQAANPKAWVLTATVAAGATGAGWRGIGLTAAMMIGITGSCLVLWALAGRTFARLLCSQKARRRVDQILGVALVATALMVAIPAVIGGSHLY